MQWNVQAVGKILESAAAPYSCVVHGSADGKVDLPAASGASGLAGIILPASNVASGTNIAANKGVDIAKEGIVRFNKATGYAVLRGDALMPYDTSGNLVPVTSMSISAGTNVEIMGFAEEASGSSDEWGYMKLDHGFYQG